MNPSRQLRLTSALTYAAAMVVAAAYCVLQSASPLPLAFGVASLSVMSAAVLGYGLGGWYSPIGAERPRFELIAVPVVVCLGAPVIGASVFLLAGFALAPSAARESPLLAVPGGIAMTIAYFSLTWPVALCAFGVAGVAMARKIGKGPATHSLRRGGAARLDSGDRPHG